MIAKTEDELQTQIDLKRKEIHSDQYAISIGELSNLYRDQELDIHPEFQRFFRWSPEQKSRFIESLLLGIPIPSLFVAQRTDGKWDVIDGLQRLATIFQLMGILKDQNGKSVKPLILTRTKYLPALEGKTWSGTPETSLSTAQQLLIKRAKLDIKIILRESDESAKFELFQRLNTGGAALSDQEIRNAMLVAANQPFYDWLQQSLAAYEPFRECITLSEKSYEERYDVELVLRFLVLRRMDAERLSQIGDIGDFLTEEMMVISNRFVRLQKKEETAFKRTFELIAENVGVDAFRRYDRDRKKFNGGFLISAFEAVALGLGYHADSISKPSPQMTDLRSRIEALWSNPEFTSSSGSGVRANIRIPKVVALGRALFKP